MAGGFGGLRAPTVAQSVRALCRLPTSVQPHQRREMPAGAFPLRNQWVPCHNCADATFGTVDSLVTTTREACQHAQVEDILGKSTGRTRSWTRQSTLAQQLLERLLGGAVVDVDAEPHGLGRRAEGARRRATPRRRAAASAATPPARWRAGPAAARPRRTGSSWSSAAPRGTGPGRGAGR